MTINVQPCAVEPNDTYLVLFIIGVFIYLVVMCLMGMTCWDLRRQLKKSKKAHKENLTSSSERRQEIRSFREHIDYVQNLIMVNDVNKVHIINGGDNNCSIHKADDGSVEIVTGRKVEKQKS